MGLPIQKAPTYNCELPVSGLKIRFRPFLVKEQNHMLVIREGESEAEIFDAIVNMVKSVTDGEVDAYKLPMADLEYLFCQIRARSVGEALNLPLICRNQGCNHVYKTNVDLLTLTVDVPETQNQIELNEELIIEMQPPLASDAMKWTGVQEHELIKPLMRTCMVRIFDSEEIFEMKDHRDSEIDEFVDSLSMEQFAKISEFFANLPALQHIESWTCENCGHENELILKGLNNFF